MTVKTLLPYKKIFHCSVVAVVPISNLAVALLSVGKGIFTFLNGVFLLYGTIESRAEKLR